MPGYVMLGMPSTSDCNVAKLAKCHESPGSRTLFAMQAVGHLPCFEQ